jgi:Fur family ferric uptake transcriptional regulator
VTIAANVPPAQFADFDQAVSELRSRGLRLSTSRRLVLKSLFENRDPVSAEKLATRSGLDLASTYRNLETFERHGLVQHVHLGHGPGLYVLVGRGEREYLFCERCRTARALEPAELDPIRIELRRRFGYEARFTHFALVGTCPECAQP